MSATASPTATSSGSVTNSAQMILQGTAMTNSYGGNIRCQVPTLTVTPYINRSGSWGLPYQGHYDDPVYDISDLDDDGRLDNPGDVLFFKRTRTGQKNNNTYNAGLSIQATIPLDGSMQERCKAAADMQLRLQEQALASRRLDLEIARLKHCGELRLKGIAFHKDSPYDVCADVVIIPKPGQVLPHKHAISYGPHAADAVAPIPIEVEPYAPSMQ